MGCGTSKKVENSAVEKLNQKEHNVSQDNIKTSEMKSEFHLKEISEGL
jgi:hypothetical protein